MVGDSGDRPKAPPGHIVVRRVRVTTRKKPASKRNSKQTRRKQQLQPGKKHLQSVKDSLKLAFATEETNVYMCTSAGIVLRTRKS